MKRLMYFLVALICLVLVCECHGQIVIPPQQIREANYGPSCAHAATITMLRWQGQYPIATWWRHNFRGGEHFVGLVRKARIAKLAYAMLLDGDIRILDYATSTGRGSVVDWSGPRGGHHAVFFCGFSVDGSIAAIIDPNTNRVHYFSKEAFLSHWRRCGGRSFMTLYDVPK